MPNHVPSAATFSTESIFGLSGFINAILLVTTRPRIFGLQGHGPPSIAEPEVQVDDTGRETVPVGDNQVDDTGETRMVGDIQVVNRQMV